MQDHTNVVKFKPYLGIDPWQKGTLWVPRGGMPDSARFLCSFEQVYAIDEVEIDCYVNRPRPRVLELWTAAYSGKPGLLSRNNLDESITPAERYIQAIFEVCQYWDEFHSIGELTRAGLIGVIQWQKLKLRIETELRHKEMSEFDDPHGLLHTATDLGLRPWHKGGDSELFVCACPARRMHHCYLQPETGHWYCGWCPRGGETPEALRDFYNEAQS